MSSANDHRPHLFGIAYRMLGRVTEAEDMVQEAYLRYHLELEGSISLPKAWLTKAVTRLCIDQLRSARRQREEYVGSWLPEPIIGENLPDELADTLSTAFMLGLWAADVIITEAFMVDTCRKAGTDDCSSAKVFSIRDAADVAEFIRARLSAQGRSDLS